MNRFVSAFGSHRRKKIEASTIKYIGVKHSFLSVAANEKLLVSICPCHQNGNLFFSWLA